MVQRTLLITGGAGFIGAHFVEHFVRNTEDSIIIFDKLNYSGSLNRLRDIKCYPEIQNRVQVLTADFSLPIADNIKSELKNVTHVLHLGAETHVDNSIRNPEPFVVANVLGTMHMLNLALELPKLECFYYFSTDEKWGSAPMDSDFAFKESDAMNPGNAYAATKAGGDMLCRAYANTHSIPIITTNTMNCYGERQHPEKFIPLCINKILKGEKVIIHGTPDKLRSGRRTYIHARNVAAGYSFLMDNHIHVSSPPDFYKTYRSLNIVGEQEVSNLELADRIATILGKPLIYEIVDFHSSRKGHDLRYKISGEKLAKLGWKPPLSFYDSLENTIKWYIQNPRWLEIK